MPAILPPRTPFRSPAEAAIHRLQADLTRARQEIATGRKADLGLAVGAAAADGARLRQASDWHTAIRDANVLAGRRLEVAQTALQGVEQTAQSFLDALIGSRGSAAGKPALPAAGRAALEALVGALNSDLGGFYVLAGADSGERPVSSYFGPAPSMAREAVRDAFVAAFGFEQSDPAVATISPDAMATFLATAFADEFGAAQWGARWSTASSLEQEHRIAPDERVRLTTNANALAFRQLAEAYVMVSDLGGSALSPAAQDVVAERAIGLVGAAISSLAAERAEIGVAEERIASASALLGVQAQATAHRLGDLEGADVFAAATAANDLMTRLEASYAMTARLQRLSLLEFI